MTLWGIQKSNFIFGLFWAKFVANCGLRRPKSGQKQHCQIIDFLLLLLVSQYEVSRYITDLLTTSTEYFEVFKIQNTYFIFGPIFGPNLGQIWAKSGPNLDPEDKKPADISFLKLWNFYCFCWYCDKKFQDDVWLVSLLLPTP